MLQLKNTKKILLAGMVVATIAKGALFSGMPVFAQNTEKEPSIPYEETFQIHETFDLKSYIQGLSFLTNEEKQQLLETYKQTAPIYDEVDKIYDEISKISDRIIADSDHLYEEIEKIYQNQAALWEKLFENTSEEQALIEDDHEYIRSSGALTKEEKEILLAEQKKLDDIYAKLDKEYDRLEQETASHYDRIDQLSKQIKELDQKDAKIWEKIEEKDNVAVPYFTEQNK